MDSDFWKASLWEVRNPEKKQDTVADAETGADSDKWPVSKTNGKQQREESKCFLSITKSEG